MWERGPIFYFSRTLRFQNVLLIPTLRYLYILSNSYGIKTNDELKAILRKINLF